MQSSSVISHQSSVAARCAKYERRLPRSWNMYGVTTYGVMAAVRDWAKPSVL